MYYLYMDGLCFPVPPAKLTVKHKNQNKTYTLINGQEINVPKNQGLKEIDFELLLPNSRYPFATYPDGFNNAEVYKSKLKELKNSKAPFVFSLIRDRGITTANDRNLLNGMGMAGKIMANLLPQRLKSTTITCTIEDSEFTDDAKEGFDYKAKIKLKEWNNNGTAVYSVKKKKSAGNKRAVSSKKRKEQKNGTYTIKKGDTLANISKKFYGSSQYTKQIINANKGKVKDPNKLKAGTVLKIPKTVSN